MNAREPDSFAADASSVQNAAIRKTAHQKITQNRCPATEAKWNQMLAEAHAEFALNSGAPQHPQHPFSIF